MRPRFIRWLWGDSSALSFVAILAAFGVGYGGFVMPFEWKAGLFVIGFALFFLDSLRFGGFQSWKLNVVGALGMTIVAALVGSFTRLAGAWLLS